MTITLKHNGSEKSTQTARVTFSSQCFSEDDLGFNFTGCDSSDLSACTTPVHTIEHIVNYYDIRTTDMAAYMLDNAGDGINPCRAARTYTILSPPPTTQLETLTISDSVVSTKLASSLVTAAQIDFYVEVTITVAKAGGDVTIKKVAMFRVNAVDCQI